MGRLERRVGGGVGGNVLMAMSEGAIVGAAVKVIGETSVTMTCGERRGFGGMLGKRRSISSVSCFWGLP